MKVVVCGAGAAGLSAAACLRGAGLDAVILERSDRVGASWRSRYPALRLNTPGWMSTMPGYRASVRRYGEFPSRDDWIRYLEDYSTHHGLEVRFGAEVWRVDRADGSWLIETNGGAVEADAVVIAIGFDHDPYVPKWPGLEGFGGELIHASDYRDPEPYRGKDVLVVGPGVTGSEVAHLIAAGGAARVRVAVRTPPHIVRRKWLGVPIQIPGTALHHMPLRVADRLGAMTERTIAGNLSRYGLPRPRVGPATALAERHQSPLFDDGFVDSVKAGRIEIVAAVEGFDGDEVLLADGTRIRPDAVIAATGYRRGLEPLVGHLGVLDERGTPLVSGGRHHPSAPGLFFTGYRTELSGQMRLMRFDARSIARALT
ncbi:MAG TPA: NAD(P)/FAD-dependent oxidoreductase [Solirubrobacterales bacterium]|jgi:putative flavoprotein involved in K+ transport|nr:NAD(P)/FAD-dependent oxidoreductase [Solirubrobacterales bacterium]